MFGSVLFFSFFLSLSSLSSVHISRCAHRQQRKRIKSTFIRNANKLQKGQPIFVNVIIFKSPLMCENYISKQSKLYNLLLNWFPFSNWENDVVFFYFPIKHWIMSSVLNCLHILTETNEPFEWEKKFRKMIFFCLAVRKRLILLEKKPDILVQKNALQN